MSGSGSGIGIQTYSSVILWHALQVQDKIGFLINNLSNSNLKQKASDIKEILTEQYWPWFCNYMVVKRAAQEQNFHLLYAALLQELQVSIQFIGIGIGKRGRVFMVAK